MSVQRSTDFGASAVSAKLQLFLVFVKATRDNLVLAYENLPNAYLVLVTAIAERLVDFFKNFDEIPTPENIWANVLTSPGVLNLQQTHAKPVLDAFEKSLTENAKDPDLYLSYLGDANGDAIRWIHSLGKYLSSRGLANTLKQVQERPLLVTFDEKATRPCASSSRLGPIGWSLQIKPFAFYGAVFAELMFVHEYLCHVVPLNGHLERDVREVWLNSCLSFGLRNLDDPDGEREPGKLIWLQFRNGYAEHFKIPPFSVGGSLSIDDLTLTLQGWPLFWWVTLGVLAAPDGENEARMISRLFNGLSRCTDEQLRLLENKHTCTSTLRVLLEFINYSL
jgi:hypothetical protein